MRKDHGRAMKTNSIYEWPDYYDWTSDGLDEDITYYTDLARRTGGPVLELGCGTGRISLAMAREGIEVVGVDRSSQMLAYAQKKASALGINKYVQWVEQDVIHLELNRKFPLVIIPYRSFLHIIHVREQIRTLQKIYHHLTDEGMLAFNVFVPNPSDLTEMEGTYHFRGVFPIPGTTEEVEVYDTTEFNHFHQLVHVNRYYERFSKDGRSLNRIKTVLKFRYIYPTELTHLLTLCKFQIRRQYGTFTHEPFYSESKELIIEATKVK